MTILHSTSSVGIELAPKLRIAALPAAFLARVRAGLDDLGQPVERHIARGGERLRDVLRPARAGEAILLASYCPFTIAGPYKEYGPVFVAAAAPLPSVGYASPDDAQAYLGASFVLRAYSRDERIVDARLSGPDRAAADLADFFAHAEVAFVLARFAAYGCYALRIERA